MHLELHAIICAVLLPHLKPDQATAQTTGNPPVANCGCFWDAHGQNSRDLHIIAEWAQCILAHLCSFADQGRSVANDVLLGENLENQKNKWEQSRKFTSSVILKHLNAA